MSKVRRYYQEGPKRAPALLRTPARETAIWRFMSLSKFLDLITRRSIYLGQLAGLQNSDPYEGSLAANRLSYLQRIMTDDGFARQELHIPSGEPINPDLRRAYAPETIAFQNQRSAERTYINCWHINSVESANLWSVYAAQGEGVAVRSTVGLLKDALGEDASAITIAPVRYVDYETYGMGPSHEDAAYFKRLSFKAERELRLRYLLPIDRCIRPHEGGKLWAPPVGVHFRIDCEKLIDAVYVSPTLGEWFRESVEALLTGLGLPKPVVKSTINDPRIL